jgi:hypothetical protein
MRTEFREGVNVALPRQTYRLTERHWTGAIAVATSERIDSLIDLSRQMAALEYELVRLEPVAP